MKKILGFILIIVSIGYTNAAFNFTVHNTSTIQFANPECFGENGHFWCTNLYLDNGYYYYIVNYFYHNLNTNENITLQPDKYFKSLGSTTTANIYKPLMSIVNNINGITKDIGTYYVTDYPYIADGKKIGKDTYSNSSYNEELKTYKAGDNISIFRFKKDIIVGNTSTYGYLFDYIYTPTTNKYRYIYTTYNQYQGALFNDSKYLYFIYYRRLCRMDLSTLVAGTNTYSFSCVDFASSTPDRLNKLQIWTDKNTGKTLIGISYYIPYTTYYKIIDFDNKKSYSVNFYSVDNKFGRKSTIDFTAIHYIDADYIKDDLYACNITDKVGNSDTIYSCDTIDKYVKDLVLLGDETLSTSTVSIQLTIIDGNSPTTTTTEKINTYQITVNGDVPEPQQQEPVPSDSHFGDIASEIQKNIPSLLINIKGQTVYLYSNGTGTIEDICTNAIQNCTNSTIQTLTLQNCIQNLNQKTPITCDTYNVLYGNCGFPQCSSIGNAIFQSKNHTIIGQERNGLIISNPKTQPVCSIGRTGTGDICIMPAPPDGVWDYLSYFPDVAQYFICQVGKTINNTISIGQDIMRIMGAVLVYQPWGEYQLQAVGIGLNIEQVGKGIQIQVTTGSNDETNKVWNVVMDVKSWILAGIDAILAVVITVFVFMYLFTNKKEE